MKSKQSILLLIFGVVFCLNGIALGQSRIRVTPSNFNSRSQLMSVFIQNQVSIIPMLKISDEKHKVLPGIKKRTTGIVFTAIGLGVLVTSAALLATADSYYYSYSSGSGGSGDLGGGLGAIGIPTGAGLLISGLIKWNKGNKKFQSYNKEMKAASEYDVK